MKPSPASLDTGIKPEPSDSAFSMCIASGPFTFDTDLSYKPWHILLESLKTTKPAVLLLVSCTPVRMAAASDAYPEQIGRTFYRH